MSNTENMQFFNETSDILNAIEYKKTNKYDTLKHTIKVDSCINKLQTGHMQYTDTIFRIDFNRKIKISKYANFVINHPMFKRTKKISQLGTLIFSDHKAGHSRYDHQIGVAALARITGENLQKNTEDQKISDKDIVILELAGLMHDVGHSAFSHTIDYALNKSHDIEHKYKLHEVRSQILIRYIIEDLAKNNPEFILDDIDIRKIQFIIEPKYYKKYFSKYELDEKLINDKNYIPIELEDFINGFQYIISNDVLDLDRIDYLYRDSMMMKDTGIISINIDNIINMLQRTLLIDDKWVFNINDYSIVYALVVTRSYFYMAKYLHPDNQIIELIFADIFEIVNEKYNYVSCMELNTKIKIQQFMELTDEKITNDMINMKNDKVERLIKGLMGDKSIYTFKGMFSVEIEKYKSDENNKVIINVPLKQFDINPLSLISKALFYNNIKLRNIIDVVNYKPVAKYKKNI